MDCLRERAEHVLVFHLLQVSERLFWEGKMSKHALSDTLSCSHRDRTGAGGVDGRDEARLLLAQSIRAEFAKKYGRGSLRFREKDILTTESCKSRQPEQGPAFV